MAGPVANFTADNYARVKVLYDYDYEDDHDNKKIVMREDEIFYLLNSEAADWWEVCRPDSPENHFYVPSTYVEVLSNISGSSVSQQQEHVDSKINIQTHSLLENAVKSVQNNFSTFKGSNKMSDDDDNSIYMNTDVKCDPEDKSFRVQVIHAKTKRPSDLPMDDDYVNLEDFRHESGLPSLNSLDSNTPPSPKTPDGEGDYANLQDLHLQQDMPEPATPDIEQSHYQKTLQETWDVYLDPTLNRLFYVNKNTNESQWKPPRGKYHEELHKIRTRSSGEYEEVILSDMADRRRNRKSRSLDYGRPAIYVETSIPEGWSYIVKDTGEDMFVNNTTQQERSGGSSPTKSPSSDSEQQKPDFLQGQGQGLVQGQRASERSKVSSERSKRFEKSRSVMIENLNLNAKPFHAGPPPPKSATLPPNFTAPIPEDLPVDGESSGKTWSNDTHHSQTMNQSVHINEPIEGMLNRCLLVNGKKSSKKWAYFYVKLTSSNLLFFKDQKAAKPQTSFPHGKYEQLVSLATCSIDKDTDKITSKKNTLVLTCPDCQILLQANDELKMQEWFLKIHTRIKEIGGSPENGQQTLTPVDRVDRKPSFKNKHSRKPSDTGSLEKKEKGMIKNVLERFMTSRTNKDQLVKKGIYKDAVFGSDIKSLCAKEKTKVPIFVSSSIAAIEKRGLEHEGIYRIGGNISNIQKLRCMVDQGESYNLDDVQWDVHVLTGTLKLFFRELKDPLFTCALFEKFLKHFLNEKATERLRGIKTTIDELPKSHYETIKMLFQHLVRVMELEKENKMGAHQLAIVFGPTLIWPEVQHQNLATSMVYQSRIVEYVLLEYNNIFR